MENGKRQDINGLCHNIVETQISKTRRTCFQPNKFSGSLNTSNGGEKHSRDFKQNNVVNKEIVKFDLASRDCSIETDDNPFLIANKRDQQLKDSSCLNSINNFASELKEKLQRLSSSKSITPPNGDNEENANSNYNGHDDRLKLQGGNFERFYHVFVKDELVKLVECVDALKVITQHYDHGNWVVKAEKMLCCEENDIHSLASKRCTCNDANIRIY